MRKRERAARRVPGGAGDQTPVNGNEVLEKVAALPVSTWSYLFDDPSVRHLGPMAQDFKAAFGLGDTDRMINGIDADGVALVAIQALYRRNQALEVRVAALEAALAARPGADPA